MTNDDTSGPDLAILVTGPLVQPPKGMSASIRSNDDFTWQNILTPERIATVRALREEIRHDEGADGQCLFVCETIKARNLLGCRSQVVYGAYLNDAGEPICNDHFWLKLADGSWFDPTCDQFGEGHDMRLIPAGSPMMARFRTPPWNDDYHPGLADQYPELDGVAWSGMTDFDWSNKLRDERGEGWWLEDTWLKTEWSARNELYGGYQKTSAPGMR